MALVFPAVTAKVMENTLNLLKKGTLQETLDPQQLKEASELCQDLQLPDYILAGLTLPPVPQFQKSNSVTNWKILNAFKPWRRLKPSKFSTNLEFLELHLPKLVNIRPIEDLDEDMLAYWKKVLKSVTVRLGTLAEKDKKHKKIDNDKVSQKCIRYITLDMCAKRHSLQRCPIKMSSTIPDLGDHIVDSKMLLSPSIF